MKNILEVYLSGNTKELDAALSRADKNLTDLGKRMKDIGQTMALRFTAPLALAGGAAVKLASDFNESLNKVDVAFKGSSAEVKAFAKTTLKQFGIAQGSALDMAALFGDMSTSMGLSTKEAAKMSTTLVSLAGDLASFKNINIEEVTTALAGVFTGETESLKRLGIVMTEANVKSYALASGIKKSYEEMSQAEKVSLRFQYVLSATQNAQGDFARTGGGAANQMRMFAEALKEVGQQFGQIVLPYVTKAFKAFNEFLVAVSESSTETKTLIMVLGGLVAAIGPVLIAVGYLSENMITGFTNASKAVKFLWTTLLNNPLAIIGTLVAGLTATYLLQLGVFKDTINVQSELNNLKENSVKSTIKEKNELERLIKIANNENVSLKERKKAIEAINAISPDFLKGITLETINTDKSKKAIDNYIVSLQKKSLLMAASAKIEELNTKKLALQTGEANAGSSIMGALSLAYGSATNNMNLMAKGAVDRAKRTEIEIKAIDELIKKTATLAGIDLNQVDPLGKKENNKNAPDTNQREFTNGLLKSTIDLKNNVVELKQNFLDLIRIQDFLKFGDLSKSMPQLSNNLSAYFDKFPQYGEKIMGITQKMSTLKTPFQAMDQQISASTTKQQEELALMAENYQKFQDNAMIMANAVGNAFTNLGMSIVNSFGLAKTGVEGFLASLLSAGVQMASEAIRQSIVNKGKVAGSKAVSTANAVETATEASAAAGPAGIFTLAPFIALAVGAVASAFSGIPAFAKGGIVSGPTMGLMGEYPGAKSNPEVIAPLNKLQSMMDIGGGNNVNVSGEFVVRGQDLILALQRAEKQKQRIG